MKKLLLAGVALVALAAAAPVSAAGDIIVTYKDDVSTLDPAIGYDWQNWSIIKSLFDGLMDYKPGTTDLVPELAESYEISPDGTQYTFKLHPEAKFHNGRPITADDVKWSIERAVNPKTQSPGAGFFSEKLPAPSVDVAPFNPGYRVETPRLPGDRKLEKQVDDLKKQIDKLQKAVDDLSKSKAEKGQ